MSFDFNNLVYPARDHSINDPLEHLEGYDIDTIDKIQQDFFCPVDRKPINCKDIVSVPFIDRLILSLKLKCTYGCNWVGELGNFKMDEHIKTCKYSLVPCKYRHYGCELKILRLEVSKHERLHSKIKQLEDTNRYLRESYLELQSCALDNRIELDEVISDNYVLVKEIKYLRKYTR